MVPKNLVFLTTEHTYMVVKKVFWILEGQQRNLLSELQKNLLRLQISVSRYFLKEKKIDGWIGIDRLIDR